MSWMDVGFGSLDVGFGNLEAGLGVWPGVCEFGCRFVSLDGCGFVSLGVGFVSLGVRFVSWGVGL